jgi:tetratricopeptide (TPR) repeat protein
MTRARFLLAILLAITAVCHAQRRLNQPSPVTVHFTVTINDNTTKAQHVTLEMMDSVGSSGAFDRRETDNDGVVVFQTLSGMHRFRISGPGIRPYEGEVDLNSNERVHHERVIVQGKTGDAVTNLTANVSSKPVPAIRLKIPDKAQKEFDKGTEALRKEQWGASLKYFEKAIHEYPDYDLAYDGLGVVQMQRNEVEQARRSFTKALELNPDFAGAGRNLARILISENNYPEALRLLKRSLETEPQNAWALTYAAYAELQAHQFEEALADARKVHELPHEGLANTHVVAARALEALARDQEAIEQWKLYLVEDPNGPNAARARAVLAANQSNRK